jgi:hypothetical protein
MILAIRHRTDRERRPDWTNARSYRRGHPLSQSDSSSTEARRFFAVMGTWRGAVNRSAHLLLARRKCCYAGFTIRDRVGRFSSFGDVCKLRRSARRGSRPIKKPEARWLNGASINPLHKPADHKPVCLLPKNLSAAEHIFSFSSGFRVDEVQGSAKLPFGAIQ